MATPTAHPVRVAHSARRGRLAAGAPGVAVIFALAAIAIWSTNALAGAAALDRLPVGIVVFVQCATATLALGTARYVRRRREPARVALERGDRRYVLALGGLGFGGTLVLQYVSFANAPIVEANIIAYGWPMFAAVWLAVAVRDRRSVAALAFACIGFAGVGLIVGGGGGFSGNGNVLGYAAALGSAFCMAFYSLGSGVCRVPALDAMVCGAVVGTLASIVLVLADGASWTPTWAWVGAAYIGLGPCAAGYAAWSAAMARSGGRLAPVGYATPLLSTIVLLVAGEPVSGPAAIAGGALIVICTVGVVASAGRSKAAPPTGPTSYRASTTCRTETLS